MTLYEELAARTSSLSPNKKTKNCIVLLVHGQDLREFLENTLNTLRGTNNTADVYVYTTSPISPAEEELAIRFRVVFVPLELPQAQEGAYANYGSDLFNLVTSVKWRIMRAALSVGYNNVIYTDTDIAFLRRFTSYVNQVSQVFGCGFQTEAMATFPQTFCTGFMFFNRRLRSLLEDIDSFNADYVAEGNDQDAYNEYVKRNPSILKRAYNFPETLFLNGLHSRLLLSPEKDFVSRRLKPFLFHANQVEGLERKKALLKHVGLWRVGVDGEPHK